MAEGLTCARRNEWTAQLPPNEPALFVRNQLLAALSPADQRLLHPCLKEVVLKPRHILEAPNREISRVFFLDKGIASVIAHIPGGGDMEVGLVGPEGMSGLAVVLGTSLSLHSTRIQCPGRASSIATEELRRMIAISKTLHEVLLRYVQAFMIQIAHTACANARAKLTERLARWLLMAQDRLGNPEIPLTHDSLALMLGVRRPGVTNALHTLEEQSSIRSRRSLIVILDRAKLESVAGGFYGGPEAEYRRLLVKRAQ
jgi:CRP-like cAMP-binding protein